MKLSVAKQNPQRGLDILIWGFNRQYIVMKKKRDDAMSFCFHESHPGRLSRVLGVSSIQGTERERERERCKDQGRQYRQADLLNPELTRIPNIDKPLSY
jgi:hypothetical protein